MKKWIVCLLCFCLSTTPVWTRANYSDSTGNAAGYSSRNAMALSMIGWGVGLAAGIATLAILLADDSSNSHSH